MAMWEHEFMRAALPSRISGNTGGRWRQCVQPGGGAVVARWGGVARREKARGGHGALAAHAHMQHACACKISIALPCAAGTLRNQLAYPARDRTGLPRQG